MSWAPLPPAPDPVAITAVADAVIRSKITIPYHDGERVALEALRAALPWATLVVAKMPVSEALKWCVEHLGLIVGLMACPGAVAAAQAEIRRASEPALRDDCRLVSETTKSMGGEHVDAASR